MVAVQYGAAADDDDIDAVRRQTHDLAIEQCGPRRRGGVRWLEFEGDAGKDALKNAGIIDADLDAFVADNPGCTIVIAMCPYEEET